MKVNDIIFRYPTDSISRRDGICRVRTFVNAESVSAVITDLGDKNTSSSVTNIIESICSLLVEKGYIPKGAIFIEHYEPDYLQKHTFSLVTFKENWVPEWEDISKSKVENITNCGSDEFNIVTANDERLLNEIEQNRVLIDPHIDLSHQEDSKILLRRIEIDKNKITKESIKSLIHSNAAETEFLKLIRADLSVLGEMYARPFDDYICFSEFPVDNGFVDFALFTGVSRMDIFLIEIKGADFNLFNSNHYDKFSSKMDIAIAQVRDRLGYIHRNISHFRSTMHQIRKRVESGETISNCFMGPTKLLEVSTEKDINIHCVVIGGRTKDDLEESRKRHDFETNFTLPIKVESWDTWIRKLRRR